MTIQRRAVVLCAAALFLSAGGALSDSIFLSFQERVDSSALVATGTLTEIREGATSANGITPRDAVVVLDQVVKGDKMQRTVLFALAPKRADGLRSSEDFDPPMGIPALWFFVAGEGGRFVLDRPDRVIPLAEAGAELRALGL